MIGFIDISGWDWAGVLVLFVAVVIHQALIEHRWRELCDAIRNRDNKRRQRD